MQEKKNVIDFKDETIKTFIGQKTNYSIVLLFSTRNEQIPGVEIAKQATSDLAAVADLFFSKYGIRSAEWKKNPLFFVRCEVEQCRDVFVEGTQKARWKQLPKLVFIKPKNTQSLDQEKWIDMGDPLQADATDMTEWISLMSGYELKIERSLWSLYGSILSFWGSALAVLYMFYPRIKNLVNKPMFWFAVSLGVYCFTMSGAVFNAIHMPPWSHVDPRTKHITYIYPSARQQFVSEGLILAVLLSGLGLLFVSFSSWIPTLKEAWQKRVGFTLLGLCFYLSLAQLMALFRVKHGWYPY